MSTVRHGLLMLWLEMRSSSPSSVAEIYSLEPVPLFLRICSNRKVESGARGRNWAQEPQRGTLRASFPAQHPTLWVRYELYYPHSDSRIFFFWSKEQYLCANIFPALEYQKNVHITRYANKWMIFLKWMLTFSHLLQKMYKEKTYFYSFVIAFYYPLKMCVTMSIYIFN